MENYKENFWVSNKVLSYGSYLCLIGNKMSDNLFYTLAHTPLNLQGIERSGHKILVCLSNHEFSIKEHQFRRSGLVVRDDEDGINNVKSILDKNPEAVALVSQVAKKYFDKETALVEYKSRIFCMLCKGKGITNKLPNYKGKVRPVYIKR